MKFTLRLVTVICYFLPFTFFLATCNNGLELRFSYNQAEADKNLLLEKESSEAVTDTAQYDQKVFNHTKKPDTIAQNVLNLTQKSSSNTSQTSTDFGGSIIRKIVMPTETSLSGIGSILYFKNITGQIAIAISLLISLILLLAFKFLTAQSTKLYLLLTAVVCKMVFIIDSFVSSVTLLWGSWSLLILLLLQLIWEFNNKMKAYRQH